MKLEYNEEGKFVPETERLVDELKADAVLILVFGSRLKGSGACCEMRVKDPQKLGWIIVEQLRELAFSIEADLDRGALKEVKESDQDGHEQEKLKHPKRGIRPGQPGHGDSL